MDQKPLVASLTVLMFSEDFPKEAVLSEPGPDEVAKAMAAAVPRFEKVASNSSELFLHSVWTDFAVIAFTLLKHTQGGSSQENARWTYRAVDRLRQHIGIPIRSQSPPPSPEHLELRFARDVEELDRDGPAGMGPQVGQQACNAPIIRFFKCYWGWSD